MSDEIVRVPFAPSLGCDKSKHFPASSGFPFLAGEFNQVGIVAGASGVKMSPDVPLRPERAAFRQSASSFTVLHFFPELV